MHSAYLNKQQQNQSTTEDFIENIQEVEFISLLSLSPNRRRILYNFTI